MYGVKTKVTLWLGSKIVNPIVEYLYNTKTELRKKKKKCYAWCATRSNVVFRRD